MQTVRTGADAGRGRRHQEAHQPGRGGFFLRGLPGGTLINSPTNIRGWTASLYTRSDQKSGNAFGVGKSVKKAIQERFWKRAGVTEEVGKNIIREIKKQSLKNIDDISDEAVRKYIDKNMYEFVEYFGGSFSKDFVDSCLEKQIGKDALDVIKESATDDKLYLKLIDKIGNEQANNILNKSSNLILIDLCMYLISTKRCSKAVI